MTEVQKLKDRLNAMGASLVHVDPGTAVTASAEDRARAINESLDRIEAGDFEILPDDE